MGATDKAVHGLMSQFGSVGHIGEAIPPMPSHSFLWGVRGVWPSEPILSVAMDFLTSFLSLTDTG